MIYYHSEHAILEYDEIQLLTDLGHDVFANGCYNDPKGHFSLPRPHIRNAMFHQDLFDISRKYPKTQIPKELIEPFDVMIFMSGQSEEALITNWPNIKHKRVIWRTIGQCTEATESKMQRLRHEGLQIIRMSPKEIGFANFAGSDALIRFYKDPEVYKDWVGNKERVINFTQSLKGRRQFCHYDEVIGSLLDYDGLVYGSGNNDLGVMNGGEVTFERQLELYKESRAYLYTGSWPACYTLSFVEAWMTGIPVVAFSKAVTQNVSSLPFYEVDELITDGVDGFIVNTIQEARKAIELLIKDYDRAKTISANARKKAIEIFGREKIMKQWELFLNK